MSAHADEIDLLTIPEFARALGCSPQTVYRHIAAGDLPVVDIAVAGSRQSKSRVTVTDAAAFIKARTRTAGT